MHSTCRTASRIATSTPRPPCHESIGLGRGHVIRSPRQSGQPPYWLSKVESPCEVQPRGNIKGPPFIHPLVQLRLRRSRRTSARNGAGLKQNRSGRRRQHSRCRRSPSQARRRWSPSCTSPTSALSCTGARGLPCPTARAPPRPTGPCAPLPSIVRWRPPSCALVPAPPSCSGGWARPRLFHPVASTRRPSSPRLCPIHTHLLVVRGNDYASRWAWRPCRGFFPPLGYLVPPLLEKEACSHPLLTFVQGGGVATPLPPEAFRDRTSLSRHNPPSPPLGIGFLA